MACCSCVLDGDRLRLEKIDLWEGFCEWEALLRSDGPWIMGCDFPFGQPIKLLRALHWPTTWSGYVATAESMGRERFGEVLTEYRTPRPKGDKEHRRCVDRLAHSISPMKLYGVPVAKMFFEGARRLLHAPVDIPPVRRMDSDRIVVEAYPGLRVRRLLGEKRISYKSDAAAGRTTGRQAARDRIVTRLRESAQHGLAVDLAGNEAKLIEDASGDSLDAFLCAWQAAWAWTMHQQGYGVPGHADPLEGWIVDPYLWELRAKPCP